MHQASLKQTINNSLPFFLISFGIVLIGFVFGWRIQQKILSFDTKPAQAKEVPNKNIPTRITIEKVKISLPIDVSSIKDGVWEISPTRASFLDISAGIGQNGNIVIYGHNKKNIFGYIRNLKIGNEIELQDKEGKKYMYKVDKIIITNPDDIQYVEPKDKETLTIYTCTGLFDSKRHIIVAYPVD